MIYSEPSIEGDIAHLLAETADIAEQGVSATWEGGAVALHGCVNCEALRVLIMRRVQAAYPELDVRDEMSVASFAAPDGQEAL